MKLKLSFGRRTFVSAFARGVLVATVTLFTLSACGDSGPGGGIPGTYTLRTVNGNPLPFIEEETADFKSELISESIVLRANNEFTLNSRYRDTITGQAPDEYDSAPIDGTWEKDGATITFGVSGSFIDGVLNGDTITIDDGTDVWVYKKI